MDGPAPSQPDYEAFIDAFNAFVALARRLEKAFAAATSELDELTGVHNRQAMVRELDREFERFRRTGQPFCIVLADLDHFKAINDAHGHAAGDIVLRAAAARLLASLRPYDGVYRYGGEEFLLHLSDIAAAEAAAIIERLRESLVGEPIGLDDTTELNVTASFGLAETSGDTSIEATIKRTDGALYRAKESGRNRLVIAE